jgi:hypothetical protein
VRQLWKRRKGESGGRKLELNGRRNENSQNLNLVYLKNGHSLEHFRHQIPRNEGQKTNKHGTKERKNANKESQKRTTLDPPLSPPLLSLDLTLISNLPSLYTLSSPRNRPSLFLTPIHSLCRFRTVLPRFT